MLRADRQDDFARRLHRRVLIAAGVIGAASLFLPLVRGYGTILFQFVVLGAWGIVASVSSGTFADQHHEIVWPIAVLVNVVLFLLPVLPVWLIGRRKPNAASILLLLWCSFYLAALFVLFPAADGP